MTSWSSLRSFGVDESEIGFGDLLGDEQRVGEEELEGVEESAGTEE